MIKVVFIYSNKTLCSSEQFDDELMIKLMFITLYYTVYMEIIEFI